jgi:hypothetical protein
VLGRVLIAHAEFYLACGEPESASSQINEALLIFNDIDSGPAWRAYLLELADRCHDQSGRRPAAMAAGHEFFSLPGALDLGFARIPRRQPRS